MQNNIQKEGQEKGIKKENRLEEEYAKAKQVFEADPNNTNLNTLNAAKESMEAFYDEKLNGVIIRALARWHGHGEKGSKCTSRVIKLGRYVTDVGGKYVKFRELNVHI